MYNFLLTLQNVSSVIIVLSMFYIMRQKPSHVQKDLVLFSSSLLIANMAYTLEMQAKTAEAAIVAVKLGYIGRPIIVFTMLFIIIDIVQIPIKPILRTLIALVQIAFIFVVYTFDKHNLFYTNVKFVNEGMFPHLVKEHGPLYYVFITLSVCYSIGMVIICMRHAKRIKSQKDREMLLIFIFLILVPNIGFFLHILNLTRGYNGTNLGYSVGALGFLYIFIRYDVFETVNVAWENVFNFIGAGLLVYDHFGNLLYENEMAKEIGVSDRVDELYKSREYIFHEDKVYRVAKLPILRDGVNMGYAYYIDNETDNYHYESLLKEEKKRADDANIQKTQFLSSMSHDIRTPMNAILGLSDIAKLHIDDKGRVIDSLNKINTSGRNLLELINEVLDMNKIESGTLELIYEDFDIVDMANEIQVMSKALVDAKSHTLTIDTKGVLHPWINGDRSRLSQIIMNLVSNSVKYTNNGGLIIVKIEETNCVDNNVSFKIIVRDNGIGISEEYLPTLFDPYTRAKDDVVSKAQGTGLGMSITKQFVEMMGGNISVKSTYGVGTTMEINVAFSLGEENGKKIGGIVLSDFSNVDYSDRRVLVAEDNPVNAEIISEFLTMAKINVEYAKDGQEAVSKIESVPDGYYDIIFMDGKMPRLDGYEATKCIRSMDRDYAKNVPIIAVTANAFSEDINYALSVGMNAHLAKPIAYDKLYEILSEYFS